MSQKRITRTEKERVYAEGRQAFDEHQRRGYNPHAASNLTFAVLWWHGWDTAEEEKESKSALLSCALTSPKSAYMIVF